MILFHNSQIADYRSPYGAVRPGTSMNIKLEAETALSAFLVLKDEISGERELEMVNHTDWFEIDFQAPDYTADISYYFRIVYSDHSSFYGNNRELCGGIGEEYESDPLPYKICVYDSCEYPEWFRNGIGYRSSYANLLPFDEKASYFKELGVNCLFLTDRPDSDGEFRQLVRHARKQGIRILCEHRLSRKELESPEFMEKLTNEDDGTLRMEIMIGAAGIFLPNSSELSRDALKTISDCIEDENPDAIFLQGTSELRQLALDFMKDCIDAGEFSMKVNGIKEKLPKEAFAASVNLMGNTKEETLLSLLGNKERVQLVFALGYALPGLPLINCGDECGADLQPDTDMLAFFKLMAKLCGEHSALRNGELQLMAFSPDDLIINRKNAEDEIEIMLNRRSYNCAFINKNNDGLRKD